MANLNVDKKIFELSPFMHRVYLCKKTNITSPSCKKSALISTNKYPK